MNPRTIARLEARIKERVAYCVEFELSDPRSTFITITGVELASDLSTAKVLYSVLGSPADRSKSARMLEQATGYVQRQLGRVLRTRRIPRLSWKYDDSIELMANMDRAISEALRRDREINPEAHAEDPGPDARANEARREQAEIDREVDDFLSEREPD